MNKLIAGLSFAALSAIASTSAFAEGGQGIGRSGTYHAADTTTSQSVKSRAEVRAEIATAYDTGTLGTLNRMAYPGHSLTGDAINAQHANRARDAAVAEAHNRAIVEYANGSVTQSGSAASR
jgi:Domain of unknown function (DUF4148)